MILGQSGQNIYPEEIEAKLNNLYLVMESLVVEREGRLVALVYPDFDKRRPTEWTRADCGDNETQPRRTEYSCSSL